MTEGITGIEEWGYVELRWIKELKPDTKIVTKGAFYLYSSMQSIETDDV